MDAKIEIRPQPGKQEKFLATSADIAIYGGAAGGGKSYGLLIEPLRHIHNPHFGGVIFRRELTMVKKEGGLWDESSKVYPLVGGIPRDGLLDWRWRHEDKYGARISFGHLEQEDSKYDWQGGQIPFIGWDELTHFTRGQFFYMMSRNRSTCGVRPYMRAGCNPDPDSFVFELIEWYIDPDTGYPIPERCGVIRYFMRDGDEQLVWASSVAELLAKFPKARPEYIKSFTFIASSLYDNKILMAADPGYMGNLMALPLVERERLLGGNWKIRPAAGLYFRRGYFKIVDKPPLRVVRRVRRWDFAATEADENKKSDPDWTVGLLLSELEDGGYCIEHVERFQGSPKTVEDAVINVARSDGVDVIVALPQDPGQAGKAQAAYFVKRLAGFQVEVERETGSKIVRAGAVSSQAEQGNISMVKAPWNDCLLAELESFPRPSAKDDQVDALSGAFNMLASAPGFYAGV